MQTFKTHQIAQIDYLLCLPVKSKHSIMYAHARIGLNTRARTYIRTRE